jgi:hypothetical protein
MRTSSVMRVISSSTTGSRHAAERLRVADVLGLVAENLRGDRVAVDVAGTVDAVGALVVGEIAARIDEVAIGGNQVLLASGDHVAGFLEIIGAEDAVAQQKGADLVQGYHGNCEVEGRHPHVWAQLHVATAAQ